MIMPPAAEYCAVCGQSLMGTGTASEDEIQDFVLRHGPELMEFIMQKSGTKQHTELKTTPKIIPPVIR
ncbi:MAG: hypothetical protein A4E42_01619 [Methanoregulaceae archaeon PtaU1.Bin222]|nr:MAG: hypothetical protein A4E42_01619 [Methanoregulaceae archaeon PtaU1.Bin222]